MGNLPKIHHIFRSYHRKRYQIQPEQLYTSTLKKPTLSNTSISVLVIWKALLKASSKGKQFVFKIQFQWREIQRDHQRTKTTSENAKLPPKNFTKPLKKKNFQTGKNICPPSSTSPPQPTSSTSSTQPSPSSTLLTNTPLPSSKPSLEDSLPVRIVDSAP